MFLFFCYDKTSEWSIDHLDYMPLYLTVYIDYNILTNTYCLIFGFPQNVFLSRFHPEFASDTFVKAI